MLPAPQLPWLLPLQPLDLLPPAALPAMQPSLGLMGAAELQQSNSTEDHPRQHEGRRSERGRDGWVQCCKAQEGVPLEPLAVSRAWCSAGSSP
mmetsp:Transcript_16620/g.45671  ORF Transcript_16620/g.45671 Transcript_16620/m.45671 type:complete len:93 (-) Transcript_16620:394-672(-)